MPIVGDFDGDGLTDIAVFRPSNGTWYIIPSSSGPSNWYSRQWATVGDIPAVGDYDGDGKSDVAIYRPSTATFWVVPSSNPTAITSQQVGQVYLGSTLADQMNIASTSPPYPSNVVFSAEVIEWLKRIGAISTIVGLAETTISSANADLTNNPIPVMVDLVPGRNGDSYVDNVGMQSGQERDRYYILSDFLGRKWQSAKSVVVRKRFANKVGPGSLPVANGVWSSTVGKPSGSATLGNGYVRLNPNFIGIEGDTGPPPAVGCAPPISN